MCLKSFLGVQEKSAVEAPTSEELFITRMKLMCRGDEVPSGTNIRQWVGFLKVIKSAVPAKTSTQVQGVFLQSPSLTPTSQSIHILKPLPSNTMYCKCTPLRKQLKGETVGDVFAVFF